MSVPTKTRRAILFNPQSPKSRVCDLADNRTPSQEIRHEFQSAENPVGVSSPKKSKAFGGLRFQKCKHTPSFNQRRLSVCAICGYERGAKYD